MCRHGDFFIASAYGAVAEVCSLWSHILLRQLRDGSNSVMKRTTGIEVHTRKVMGVFEDVINH
jgi:hypothetical protein